MPVVLTNDDKDTKFFIDLGDGSGAEGVFVTPMPDSARDALRKKFTTRKMTRSGLQEDVDTTAVYHARLKRTIKDWVGFVDMNGGVIPCTPENIVMLAEMNPMLFMEILDKSERLAEQDKAEFEKN